jgi:hypothetical protein
MPENEICVVHLVRAINGVQPLEQFLQSYEHHAAGIEHDFLFVLKGFEGERVAPEFEAQLQKVRHRRLFVADSGFDITSYFLAAEAALADRLCFLNSFSVILANNWLSHLHRAALLSGVGAVGATGSYQGVRVDQRLSRDVARMTGRPAWIQVLLRLPHVARLNAWNHARIFPYFPNPHLRTNAFMLRRETMLALRRIVMRTKRQSYEFESGKNGMTRQILEMGKSVCVVGRDGQVFSIKDWGISGTFWMAGQENLLVSDNQTRRYQEADSQARQLYKRLAWGDGPHRIPISELSVND